MYQCGVSQLFISEQRECPRECPYWAPSPIWKYVGVCSEEENCNLFNPILNYPDKVNNVCLPCKVFGCVSCKYSIPDDSKVPITDKMKKLPDYCIQCAKGYKRSEDGTECYFVKSNIWSNVLVIMCLLILVSIAILSARLILDGKKLNKNLKSLEYALRMRQKKVLRKKEENGRTLYELSTDLTKNNISGVGLMLYFRNLVFMTMVMCLLFFASLSHVHIPCSKMIRIFREPFRVYYFKSPQEVPRNFIYNFFNKNANKLVDDIFNFKSVDEAINWNVKQYSNEVSGVMHVLYVSIMIMTLVYLVSQRKVMEKHTSKSTRLKEYTLIFKNLPSSMISESKISEMIYESTKIKPSSISICYDLKESKRKIDQFLESLEDLDNREDIYVNFDKIESFNKEFVNLKSSGECFVTFETKKEAEMILHNLKSNRFKVHKCEVEPENVMWENVGHEERIKIKIFFISLVSAFSLVAYSVLFFVPYAAYFISSPMTHILELLVLSVFVEGGNLLVSLMLKWMIERAGIINREVVEGYLMICNYFIKVFNLVLNIILSHIINYGGRNKLMSLIKRSKYPFTPTFRVGEEVSFGLSFCIYMVNVLIVLPNLVFLGLHYGLPALNAFLVFTLDVEPKQASKILKFPIFNLSDNYSEDMSQITCCLLFLFFIRDRKQACLLFFTICVSFFINYLKSHFIVLRRSTQKFFSTSRLAHFNFTLWFFPTLILAVCPAYWEWRGGEETFYGIVTSGILHFLLYFVMIFFVFHSRPAPESSSQLTDLLEETRVSELEAELGYQQSNPVYKLKVLTKEYNVL